MPVQCTTKTILRLSIQEPHVRCIHGEGASIDDYYLSAEDVSGVNSPSQMSVPFKSAALENGRFVALFELILSSDQASVSGAGVIFAAGPKDSTGALEEHIYVRLTDSLLESQLVPLHHSRDTILLTCFCKSNPFSCKCSTCVLFLPRW